MARVLFIGQESETVDFSDPALPPGLDAKKINAGIAIAATSLKNRAQSRLSPRVARNATLTPVFATLTPVFDALSVSPMALYRYISGKEDMFELMVDAVQPAPSRSRKDYGWRDIMCNHARMIRMMLLQHPWITELPPRLGALSCRLH